jgi:hypothetical protein
LHIAATTLQQNFADCSNNTEDCKENSETLCRLQRKLHTTPLLKNAITNLKRVACNNVSDHNLHNEQQPTAAITPHPNKLISFRGNDGNTSYSDPVYKHLRPEFLLQLLW